MSLFGKDDSVKVTQPTSDKTLKQQARVASDYWAKLKNINGITEVKPFSFIYEIRNNLSGVFCDSVIEAFESSKTLQEPGKTVTGVNLNMKRSLDIVLNDDALNNSTWRAIDKELIKNIKKAAKKLWELFPQFYRISLGLECFQIQKTYPNVLGFNWHVDGGLGAAPNREWAIIWYLNDIDEGGTTNFLHYDVQVRPERGKLVLFPCSWMHLHNAGPPIGQHKYIITSMFIRD